MSLRNTLFVALIVGLVGCSAELPDLSPQDSGASVQWPKPDVGRYLVETADEVEGFEDADLRGWGAPGQAVVVETGSGIAQVIDEGSQLTYRLADDRIALAGQRAVALQVTSGDDAGLATLTSNPFVPQAPHLLFTQLSEVDARGIELWVEVIPEGEDGSLIHQLPVVTGGHRPGLETDDERLVEFPEIGYDEGNAGSPVFQAVDLTAFFARQISVQVRFSQRTLAEPHDFFSLIDDVCVVEVPEAYQDEIPVIGPDWTL
jgi:hypothetical protein